MQWNRVIIISPPKMRASARRLATGLASKTGLPAFLVRTNSKTYQPRWKDYIINWGYSKHTEYIAPLMCNTPDSVSSAVDKIETFHTLMENNVQTVPYTNNKAIAQVWLDNGHTVVCRTTTKGFGGEGIILCIDDDELPDCQLYTQYIKKKHEYRVHVWWPDVIDTTVKRKKKGVEHNHKIRNHGNGWVYCREGIEPDERRNKMAQDAINALGLWFGAVDIIYNEKQDKYYVLEVNSAPGLVETTLNAYIDSFAKEIMK